MPILHAIVTVAFTIITLAIRRHVPNALEGRTQMNTGCRVAKNVEAVSALPVTLLGALTAGASFLARFPMQRSTRLNVPTMLPLETHAA
jgi:hypothetical protein